MQVAGGLPFVRGRDISACEDLLEAYFMQVTTSSFSMNWKALYYCYRDRNCIVTIIVIIAVVLVVIVVCHHCAEGSVVDAAACSFLEPGIWTRLTAVKEFTC